MLLLLLGDVIVIEGSPEEVQVAKESLENFTEGLVSDGCGSGCGYHVLVDGYYGVC